MKKKNVIIRTIFSLVFVLFALLTKAQITAVKITDVRSGKGQIILKIFKDGESYEKDKPFKVIPFEKKDLLNGTMNVSIDLSPGTYGIVLTDDENKNGKLDTNFIGMPKEGFGFSNYFLTKLKKPSFDDFKMDLKEGNNQVTIKIKYM